MLCRRPYIRDPSGKIFRSTDKSQWYQGVPFPCGRCIPCLINKRRVWTCRLTLEFLTTGKGLYITLTYRDDDLPYSPSYKPTLCKRDFQLFMKRLRKSLSPLIFRFFACGEYGEENGRPHFHAILFGLDESHIAAVADAWPHGFTSCRAAEPNAIQYVAGYVLKKIIKKEDSSDDRVPEFSLSSRRPGIGSVAIDAISKALKDHPEAFRIGDFDQDVPGSLSIQGRFFPLGRYMIRHLRDALGMDSDRESLEYIEDMRSLFFSKASPTPHSEDFRKLYHYASEYKTSSLLAALLMSQDEGKALRAAFKHRLSLSKRTL